MAPRELGARADSGPYDGPVEALEETLLGIVREGIKQGLGDAQSLPHLTPYQLLRLLGVKKTSPKPPGWADERLRQMREFLGE